MKKGKEVVWFIFSLLFILSYLKDLNFSIVRYMAIVVLQIIPLAEIIYRKQKILLSKNMAIISIALSLFMLISSMSSEYIFESLYKTLSIIDLLVMTTLLLPVFFKDMDMYQILKMPFLAFTFVLSYCALFYANDFIFTFGSGRLGNDTRLYAGFLHPNTLGIFAFLCFVLGFFLLIRFREKFKSKRLFLVVVLYAIVLSLYLIYRSDCRTAMVCLGILLLLEIFQLIFKHKKVKVIVLSIIALFFTYYVITHLYLFEFEVIDKILSYRLTYVKEAFLTLMQNHQLLLGAGAFRNSNLGDYDVLLVDNGYMNVIYQYGILVFVTMLCYLIGIFKMNCKLKVPYKVELIYFFMIFLIYSLADNILLNIGNFFAIFVYAIIFIEYRKGIKENG